MLPEDLELVRRAYAMFAARNVDALLDGFVAPDVEWSTTPGVPFERTYHGVEEMRRAMADWMGQFDDFTTVVEHIADAGEHALVCHPCRVGAATAASRWTRRSGRS